MDGRGRMGEEGQRKGITRNGNEWCGEVVDEKKE